jgi:hypothetical protein
MTDQCVDCLNVNFNELSQDSSVAINNINVLFDHSDSSIFIGEDSLYVNIGRDILNVNFSEDANVEGLKNFNYEIIDFLLYVYYGMQMTVFDELRIDSYGINLDGTIVLEA